MIQIMRTHFSGPRKCASLYGIRGALKTRAVGRKGDYGRTIIKYLFALIHRRAGAIFLTAVQPASAELVLPPNFISPEVPHDVPTGAIASQR